MKIVGLAVLFLFVACRATSIPGPTPKKEDPPAAAPSLPTEGFIPVPFPGPTGAKGEKGNPGAPGLATTTFVTGPQGDTGPAGATGSAGLPGAPGATGEQGPPGKVGNAVILMATKTYSPDTYYDGFYEPEGTVTVFLPEDIQVIDGNGAGGKTYLYLGGIRCEYRGSGNGNRYDFKYCKEDGGIGPVVPLAVPKKPFAVSGPWTLRLEDGNGRCGVTQVQATVQAQQ